MAKSTPPIHNLNVIMTKNKTLLFEQIKELIKAKIAFSVCEEYGEYTLTYSSGPIKQS